MTVSSPADDPRHSGFLDLCLFYGDFNRSVFLEAIRHWFIESANARELKSLPAPFSAAYSTPFTAFIALCPAAA